MERSGSRILDRSFRVVDGARKNTETTLRLARDYYLSYFAGLQRTLNRQSLVNSGIRIWDWDSPPSIRRFVEVVNISLRDLAKFNYDSFPAYVLSPDHWGRSIHQISAEISDNGITFIGHGTFGDKILDARIALNPRILMRTKQNEKVLEERELLEEQDVLTRAQAIIELTIAVDTIIRKRLKEAKSKQFPISTAPTP